MDSQPSSSDLDPRFLRAHLPPPISLQPPSSWSSSVASNVLTSWKMRPEGYMEDLMRHYNDVGVIGRAAGESTIASRDRSHSLLTIITLPTAGIVLSSDVDTIPPPVPGTWEYGVSKPRKFEASSSSSSLAPPALYAPPRASMDSTWFYHHPLMKQKLLLPTTSFKRNDRYFTADAIPTSTSQVS